jgi:opacity protein-like surface antigen
MSVVSTKVGSIAALTLALTGIASAADLRPPVRARAYVPAFSWTGCYLGGYVGGAWSDNDTTFTDLGNATFASYSAGSRRLGARVYIPGTWVWIAAFLVAAR